MTAPCTIWTARDYTGTRTDIQYGDYSDVRLTGAYANTMSSIKIAEWTKVELYSEYNFGGTKIMLVGPYANPLVTNISFNDKLRSIKVIYTVPTIAQQVSCCRGQSDSFCGKYLPGSAACDDTNMNYCPNVMDSQCRSWCDKNPALCDNMVIAWCNKNPTDPYCACIKSPAGSKLAVNPKCFDLNCIKTGYQTTSMRSINCPSIVSCEMQVSVANSGTQLGTYIPLEQNCGAKTTTAYTPPANTTTNISGQSGAVGGQSTVTNMPMSPQTTASNQNTMLLYMFLLFVFVIFAVIIGLLIMNNDVQDSDLPPTEAFSAY